MPSFREQSAELAATLAAFAAQAEQVEAIARLLADGLLAGHTLFSCGNGGSAADAMHLAEELIGRYRGDRRPLPAICLNADVAPSPVSPTTSATSMSSHASCAAWRAPATP